MTPERDAIAEKLRYNSRLSAALMSYAPVVGDKSGAYCKGWWSGLVGDCDSIARLVLTNQSTLIDDAQADLDSIVDEVREGVDWMRTNVAGFNSTVLMTCVMIASSTSVSIPVLPVNPADEKLVDDLVRRATQNQPKRSLLAPDCISCGGDFGKHKIGCRVPK